MILYDGRLRVLDYIIIAAITATLLLVALLWDVTMRTQHAMMEVSLRRPPQVHYREIQRPMTIHLPDAKYFDLHIAGKEWDLAFNEDAGEEDNR